MSPPSTIVLEQTINYYYPRTVLHLLSFNEFKISVAESLHSSLTLEGERTKQEVQSYCYVF